MMELSRFSTVSMKVYEVVLYCVYNTETLINSFKVCIIIPYVLHEDYRNIEI